MQRIEELTQEELVALSEDEIQRFIEIKVADAGVMPTPLPVEITVESAGIIASERVYEVAGVLLRNKHDAEKVAVMEILKTAYDWNISYTYKWLEQQTENAIKEVFYYKQEDIVRVKKVLVDSKAKKDAYKTQKDEYNEFLKKTGEMRANVWGVVNEAKSLQREIDLAKKTYEKHLDLADQDKQVAGKFFRDAYKGREDLIENVLGVVAEQSVAD